jgi:hypothetical protein
MMEELGTTTKPTGVLAHGDASVGLRLSYVFPHRADARRGECSTGSVNNGKVTSGRDKPFVLVF